MKPRSAITLLLSAATAAAAAPAADAGRLWTAKIQPLLDLHCVKCHGPIEQKGGLELDTPQAVLKGGAAGPVVVAGRPEESPLYKNLAPGADPHMPPKKQLGDREREAVRLWIAAMQDAPRAEQAVENKERRFTSIPEAVDTLVEEGWQSRGVTPAPGLEDRLWCRRIYLDLAGRVPSVQEVDTFLAQPREQRREALVDSLLATNEYAVRMRELWDTFMMGRATRPGVDDKRKQNAWWTFLETAFKTNRPWNETVRTALAGRQDKPQDKGASWFLFERKNDHQAIAEAVAPIIYATKVDCAQCHDHPLAREIKQSHYWGLVTAFNRGKNVEGTNGVAESAVGGFVNFTNLKKESQPAVVTLLTGRTLAETWLSGDKKEEDSDDKYVDPKAKVRVPKYSRREAFAELATHENPLLAKAFVNRMWAALLGRGIVHPADEINARNVPSHPELLEWLARDFAANGHDARRFVRGLVLSKVYALGAGTGEAPPESFAGAPERPLTAEQISRSWRVAAGLPAEDDALRRAVVKAIPDVLPREYSASFQQAQFLSNSPAVENLLKTAPGGTLEKLASIADKSARVQAAFQAVYGRNPDAEEASVSLQFLSARGERSSEATRDLLWALMTGAEFLTMP
jgi:mono/diheme cytochrome c family protein